MCYSYEKFRLQGRHHHILLMSTLNSEYIKIITHFHWIILELFLFKLIIYIVKYLIESVKTKLWQPTF